MMMESAEKVRLVRCPKCHNLLPELHDYSLYHCGGCGALLHAKAELQEDKCLPESCCDDDDESFGETMGRRSATTSTHLRVAALPDIEPGVGSLSLDRRSSEEGIGDTEPGVGEIKDGSSKGMLGVDVRNLSTPGISPDGEGGGRFRFKTGCENELQKTEPVSGWRKSGAGNVIGSLHDGYSMSKYPDEGPSGCNFVAMYDSRGALLPGKHDVMDGSNGVHLPERDCGELLRKLNELKIQLTQSYNIGSTVSRDRDRDASGNSNARSHVISLMAREQFDDAYRHGAGLPYFGQHPNSLRHATNHYPGFGDHRVMEMHRSCPGPYDRVLPHGLISGQYLDPSCDPLRPVLTALIPHQWTRACFSCVDKHREASAPPVLPSKSLNYLEHPSAFGSSCIGPQDVVPPLSSHLRRSLFRQPGQLNSEGFLRHRWMHRAVTFGGRRRSHPITGGSPFLTCNCCFELLRLPRKIIPSKAKKGGKIRCGACSTVISYDPTYKKLVFSARMEVKKATAKDSSCEVIRGCYSQSHGYGTGASDDDSGHDCLSSERPRVSLTGGCNNLSLTKTPETESISPRISDQENSPTGLDNSSGESVLRSMNVDCSPRLLGSPLLDHFDHSSNCFGKGSRSSMSDHEKEATLAKEMEMSFDEFSDDAVSGDSWDTDGDHDRPRRNKGESFPSNIFKKSFKDVTRSSQGEERVKGKVYVNGHLVPDRSIKKAEKLAGPIQAGKYWYDFRAGFWGVMSGPCLGIIPPYIQEFNYPMKEKCAGGDTGVFVNGRELHQKDLDLLATRGLPIGRDRSNMIEISGRVYDEDSGKELDCLGKLAPTVEKAKHGFGMRAPKATDT